MDLERLFLSLVLWALITAFLFIAAKPFDQKETAPREARERPPEIGELEAEIARLRDQLAASRAQAQGDLKAATFETLQSLLVNYPSARRMAETKPDLPARNFSALFIPLENLLADWGYEPIGAVWEPVAYDPQIHQADEADMVEGEAVYVRFIGYRDGAAILAPAKVSRTLPPGV